ncbi:fructose-1,6-bisphosphate aldolase/phosphatase [Methylibium rhizosphaerae]|uniref:fructose-1,6-bisphosphate aldolase/phosphatase n=1 Tax=Methylibium rhizosphaerae TaxID=2570323 RepID=UPI00112E49F0|nr:fructose-1,6-bisphosphate aldolase/phosphatase [Methylibium rhizosphaerae]
MKMTLSVIKADIGSIGGHIAPSHALLESVRARVKQQGEGLLVDHRVTHTGDDIAILMTHRCGAGDARIHKLAWDAFVAGTAVAREQGLYGAGQDLLKDAFSGNVKGMGPAVAEIEMDERPSEPVLFFAADKTDPGAFNLPLYLAFADPMSTPGLLLSPAMSQGFRFTIMDVNHTEGDRVITLEAPQQLYEIAALLRDPERYVVESVHSRATGEQAAAVATSRLHNIAGKYTGKDDPVMLVRTQMNFPATGEVLAPFAIGHFVAGGMRGSHNMPLMPVPQNTGTSYFDGPPLVSCAALSVHGGRLTELLDCFAHPFWDEVRHRVAAKAMDMRAQGFVGAAMLPMSELEYTGITRLMEVLDGRFQVRREKTAG